VVFCKRRGSKHLGITFLINFRVNFKVLNDAIYKGNCKSAKKETGRNAAVYMSVLVNRFLK
jgi:hypothetical protein